MISLGWRNQFHFPAPEVVARYAARGTRVLRTDRDGAIPLAISPEGRPDRAVRARLPAPIRRNRTGPSDEAPHAAGPGVRRTLIAALAAGLRDRAAAAAAARPRPAGGGRRGPGARRAGSRRGTFRAGARVRAADRRSGERAGPGRRCAAATGRAPRSGSAPRSPSTKTSRRRTSTWRPCSSTATRRRTRSARRGPRSPSIPGYADARLLTAELLLRLGKLDDARWELEKLCAAAPDRADAHAANALVLARLGRTSAAEQEARRALEIDATCPPRTGRAPRSFVAPAISRPPAASWTSSSRRTPAAIDDRLAHAVVAAGRGLWSQAARELEALREAAPRRPEVHFAAAFVALARERTRGRAARRRRRAGVARRTTRRRGWCAPRPCRASAATPRCGASWTVSSPRRRRRMAAERARAERTLRARSTVLEIQ